MSAPTNTFTDHAGTIGAANEGNGLLGSIPSSVKHPRVLLGVVDAGGATLVFRAKPIGLSNYYCVPARSLKTGLPVDASGFAPASGELFEFDVNGCDTWEVYASVYSTEVSLEERVQPTAPGGAPIVQNASANASTFSAGLTLNGATGNNDVAIPDNLASALDITEGANSYMNFVTTNGSEGIALGKRVTGLRTAGGATAAAITGATTLTLADAGGVFNIDQDAAFDIDLPSPTTGEGCRYTFVVTDVGANNVTITVAGGAATFVGTIVNDVTSVLPATGSTITFASGVTALGDTVEIISLTTGLYLVRAVTSAAGGITIS